MKTIQGERAVPENQYYKVFSSSLFDKVLDLLTSLTLITIHYNSLLSLFFLIFKKTLVVCVIRRIIIFV